MIQTLATPVLAISLCIVGIDNWFDWGLFDPARGGDPAALAKSRVTACFPKLTDYQAAFGGDAAAFNKLHGRLSQNSHYFRLTSIVSIGTAQFALYSLLLRDPSGQVRPIQRSFVAD